MGGWMDTLAFGGWHTLKHFASVDTTMNTTMDTTMNTTVDTTVYSSDTNPVSSSFLFFVPLRSSLFRGTTISWNC